MPVNLNVGLSRKIGQPNFGSRGASLHLEVELDAAAIDAPGRLRERIQHLYSLMRASIDEELNSAGAGGHGAPSPARREMTCQANRNGDNAHGFNGAIRFATPGQVRAIQAIARKKQIDLPRLLQERFDTDRADELTVHDASVLIADLDARPEVVAS